MRGWKAIALLVAATASLGAFASYRFTRAGAWLPRPTTEFGYWQATEQTVPRETLGLLGNPKASAFVYNNPFSDEVQVSLVAAGPFENYHDPTVCVGEGAFRLTAKRTFELDGPGSAKVRAMIFRHRTEPTFRIVMYYWQQNRDGTTDHEPRMGNYKDMKARFATGYGAVVKGRQTVIVRNYMLFNEADDPQGVHAQRCVHEVSRRIYRDLLAAGKQGA